MGRKVFVCGASGFLGTALCRRLSGAGDEVHGVSRVARRLGTTATRWWHDDLTRAGAATKLLETIRPEVVFNLSGVPDARPDRSRVLPTLVGNALTAVNLLLAAAESGCKRFVHCASLQEPEAGLRRTFAPGSPYTLSKSVASAYVDLFHRLYQVPTVTLHLSIVYGPGEESRERLIPYVIRSLFRGERPQLSSGDRPVDWIYLEDAVDAFVSAAEVDGVEGKSFDVGSGVPVSIREVVEEIARIIDAGVSPQFGVLPDRPAEPLRQADPERVFAALGWRPRTPLRAGLEATIDWYRSRSFEPPDV